LARKPRCKPWPVDPEINKINGLCECYRKRLFFLRGAFFYTCSPYGEPHVKLPQTGKDIET